MRLLLRRACRLLARLFPPNGVPAPAWLIAHGGPPVLFGPLRPDYPMLAGRGSRQAFLQGVLCIRSTCILFILMWFMAAS